MRNPKAPVRWWWEMEAWAAKSGHLWSWAVQEHRKQAGSGSKSLLVTVTERNTFFYALRDGWKKPSSKGSFPNRKPGVNGNHSSSTSFLESCDFTLRSDGGTGILGCELSTISLASNLELSLFVLASYGAILIKVSGGTKEKPWIFLSPKHCFQCSIHMNHLT